MRKQAEPEPDHLQELGYEQRDASLSTIIKWVAGLFFFVGAASVAALILYVLFVPHEPEAAPAVEERRLPPEPRVQGNPIPDMQKFRANEEKALTGYAWKDKAKGVVQIPVNRAVDLMADRLKIGP